MCLWVQSNTLILALLLALSRDLWRALAPKGQNTLKSANDVSAPNLDLCVDSPICCLAPLAWALMVGSFSVRFWDWLPRSSSRGSKSSDPNPVTQQLLMVSTWFLQSWLPYLFSLTCGWDLSSVFPETDDTLPTLVLRPPNLVCSFWPWLPYHSEY